MTAIQTTCPYCGVGCGVRATPAEGRSVVIRGDIGHPANAGRLCSKGTHLGETVGLEGRLLEPMIGKASVRWSLALDLVAERFRKTIEEHGPDSVAFYVSGQLLTEDYYVANKLMKGFIGSGNIDTNSRLCMSSAVSAHIRAFGEDVVPCNYADLDSADLIVLVGSNTAWCHPIVWQRIEAARASRGTRLVVIDPRRTETAAGADLHLPIRADGDVALFNGLLSYLNQVDALDQAYLSAHCAVPENFWAALSGGDPAQVAEEIGVSEDDLLRFYEMVRTTPKMVTMFSQGANQSRQGTDKGNAIINVHLATGRIAQPGAGPFSITGQPNAMGGREVGGLASTLAAHMAFEPENVDRVRRFWNAPRTTARAGLKAVDMFDAVADGRIKAIWIMATNPAVSLPDAQKVRDALARCPFVVVSDVIADTDTSRFAHVRLPALAWGEKDGTVTNSERTISRQRAFFAAPGEAKADWWIIDQVARRMGYAAAFNFNSANQIFSEHCALTAFENNNNRCLNLAAQIGLSDEAFDRLTPFKWGGEQPFADGRYSLPDGRARLISVIPETFTQGSEDKPLTLNNGRYRDQWHTMTRTGLSPRLSQHRREPLIEIHPEDATARAVADGGLARISTDQGSSIYRVSVHEGQRRGDIFVPIHWTDQMASGGRTGLLPAPALDPHSGQPGFKATAAQVSAVTPEWRGFLVTRSLPSNPDCVWWVRSKVAGGWLTEVAGDGDAGAVFAAILPQGDRIDAIDQRRGTVRIGILAEGQLQAALFVTRDGQLPTRDWIISQLENAELAAPLSLLAGRPAVAQADMGPVICVCFNVGLNTLLASIASEQLTSVEAVGAALQAGTNCGSCRPAIADLLREKEPACVAQ